MQPSDSSVMEKQSAAPAAPPPTAETAPSSAPWTRAGRKTLRQVLDQMSASTSRHSRKQRSANFAPAGPGATAPGVLTFHHPADEAPGPGVAHGCLWICLWICVLLFCHSRSSFPHASGFSRMRTSAGAEQAANWRPQQVKVEEALK